MFLGKYSIVGVSHKSKNGSNILFKEFKEDFQNLRHLNLFFIICLKWHKI